MVGRHALHGLADLVEVLRDGQLHLPVRVQQAEVAVQLLAVVPRQLRADAVQRDVQRPTIGLQVSRQRRVMQTMQELSFCTVVDVSEWLAVHANEDAATSMQLLCQASQDD